MKSGFWGIVSNLVKLSAPIFWGNLAQILISVIDTIVAGRYSTLALGSISVASAIVMTVTIGAIGLVLSVSPVIANYRGKNIKSKKYFILTVLFSLIVSLPFFLVLELFLKYIDCIKLSADMLPYIKQYIAICAWSVFPSTVFVAIKEFLQAYEKVVFANVLMILTVVLNAALNVVLVFGFGAIPSLGVAGLSLATLASKTFGALVILLYCAPLFKAQFSYSSKYIKDLFKIGAPMSLAIFFEFLGFNLTAVLIGKFSALYAAVHNIILAIANVTYMVALSIGSAAAVKVGYYNGRHDKTNIINYSLANLVVILGVCALTFTILALWHREIIGIFSSDREVILLGSKILKIAVCFLFLDGIQCACAGVLKGLKDTKIIMYTMFIAHLLIAIPLGSYLAFCHGIVLEGFWLALALAIFLAALICACRVIYKIKNY